MANNAERAATAAAARAAEAEVKASDDTAAAAAEQLAAAQADAERAAAEAQREADEKAAAAMEATVVAVNAADIAQRLASAQQKRDRAFALLAEAAETEADAVSASASIGGYDTGAAFIPTIENAVAPAGGLSVAQRVGQTPSMSPGLTNLANQSGATVALPYSLIQRQESLQASIRANENPMNKIEPGGHFIVNGIAVDANGFPRA